MTIINTAQATTLALSLLSTTGAAFADSLNAWVVKQWTESSQSMISVMDTSEKDLQPDDIGIESLHGKTWIIGALCSYIYKWCQNYNWGTNFMLWKDGLPLLQKQIKAKSIHYKKGVSVAAMIHQEFKWKTITNIYEIRRDSSYCIIYIDGNGHSHTQPVTIRYKVL